MGALRMAKRIPEKLNYKTDSEIKHHIGDMSDDKLLAIYRSCRRALVSAITGVAIDSTVAMFNILFITATLLNTWQAGVGWINYRRVKKEINRRRERSDFQDRLEKEDHYIRDILSAAMIKAGIITISFGTLDMLGIGHTAADLVLAHGSHIHQSVADAGAQHMVNAHQAVPTPEDLQMQHPDLDAFDNAVHKPLAPLEHKAAEAAQYMTGFYFDPAGNMVVTDPLLASNVTTAESLGVALGQGAADELGPPALIDVGQEEARKNLQIRRSERLSHSVALA